MDIKELHSHLDGRLDRIETKLDDAMTTQSTHKSQIEHLQGFAKLVISILIACAGFLALAYFNPTK